MKKGFGKLGILGLIFAIIYLPFGIIFKLVKRYM